MKRLYIKPDGQAVLLDNPEPDIEKEGAIVNVEFALISAGTELSLIESSRSMLTRFLKEKRIRNKALEIIKKRNIKEIWFYFKRFILKSKGHRRFTAPFPRLKSPGYSCSGVVLESNVKGVLPGDKVACAGSNHAERIYSAKNMFVKVPEGVSQEEAAFATVGAIALQSIHQARIQPGELVGVIGTGLIGQIVVQLAVAAGARVIAFDLLQSRLELARKFGAEEAINPVGGAAKAKVDVLTNGTGLDVVIVPASSKNPEPLVTAFEIVRNKGRVVLLGAVPINIPRTNFYEKEVEFLISRSYGAGRYDPYYEKEGHDYPITHVRWTENRNMQLVLEMIARGKLDVKTLITGIVPAEKATEAYTALKNDPERALAMLLHFNTLDRTDDWEPPGESPETGKNGKDVLKIGLIGCGSFAQANHLPHLVSSERCEIVGISTRSKASSEKCRKKYSPRYTTTNYKDIINDDTIDTVFIYTRHGQHAPFAIEAMRAGKNVFSEKPMGITWQECLDVARVSKETGKRYMIGFNRRMSPFIIKARELLAQMNNPIIISYRIAAPYVPSNHWVYDPKDGGGRVIGEACHFFDLILYLMKSKPVELVARGGALSNRDVDFIDNFTCMLHFEDGSLATIVYSDLNAEGMSKERIEIFSGLSSIFIDDFKKMEVGGFLAGNMSRPYQDKGHGNEIANVIESNLGLAEPFIDAEQALEAMRLCFLAERSVREGKSIRIDELGREEA